MSYLVPGKLLRPIVLITVLIVVGSGACALFLHDSSNIRYVYDKPGSIFWFAYWKKRGDAIVVTKDKSVQFWVYLSGQEAHEGKEGYVYGCTFVTPRGEKEFFYFAESDEVSFG